MDGEEALHHNIWNCEWFDSACLVLLQGIYAYLYVELHHVVSTTIAIDFNHTHTHTLGRNSLIPWTFETICALEPSKSSESLNSLTVAARMSLKSFGQRKWQRQKMM